MCTLALTQRHASRDHRVNVSMAASPALSGPQRETRMMDHVTRFRRTGLAAADGAGSASGGHSTGHRSVSARPPRHSGGRHGKRRAGSRGRASPAPLPHSGPGTDSPVQGRVAPEDTASWLSLLTFSWCKPLVAKAARQGGLVQSDLPPVAVEDAALDVQRAFREAWRRERARRSPSLLRALVAVHRRRCVGATWWRATWWRARGVPMACCHGLLAVQTGCRAAPCTRD